MNDRLCVVMPVYNEEAAIGGVLEKWTAALSALDVDYEIRVYNDGSKDHTLEVLRESAAKLPRIRICDKANSGHGPTILRGYREAANDGFDWILQIDSDDEMGPEAFPALWAKRDQCDFLVGRRHGRIQQLPRRVVSAVSRLAVRLLYGKGNVWDVNSPYRLYRVSAFCKDFESIPENTFAPNVILTGVAARGNLRTFEMPVPQHDRTTGCVSIRKWKLLKAAVRSMLQTIAYARCCESPKAIYVLLALAIIGCAVKLVLAWKVGPTYDTESFCMVGDSVLNGLTPYAVGKRYNYGPVWGYFIAVMRYLFGGSLHYAVVIPLIVADLAIAWMLFRKGWRAAAILFLMSPFGMIVTGYMRMFDGVAIAIALFGVLTWGNDDSADKWRTMKLSLILGLSIATKHILVFFPFWLFFRERTTRDRLTVLLVPLAVFGFSFAFPMGHELIRGGIPAVHDFIANLLANVTGYNPWNEYDVSFWRDFMPRALLPAMPFEQLMMIAMLITGWFFRKKSVFGAFVAYLAAIVLFAPGHFVQYWMIPLVFVSVMGFWCSIAYGMIAAWGLISSMSVAGGFCWVICLSEGSSQFLLALLLLYLVVFSRSTGSAMGD